MTFDLTIVGLILFVALLGAFAGAARQLAQLAGVAAAYLCARPLGKLVGPRFALALHAPKVVGIVAATLLAFIAIVVLIRLALTEVLRRLLAGKDPRDRGLDRALGFALGALKAGLVCYLILCMLAFVENNVLVAGKRIGLSPKDSLLFALCRRYNLIERTHFGPVQDFARIARAMGHADERKRLEGSPDFRAIEHDPRFRDALAEKDLQRAIEDGDYGALLRNNRVLELIQDPAAASRLEGAADRLP